MSLNIPSPSGGTVTAEIAWEYRVEDKVGRQTVVNGGNIALNLGTPAAALAMTLAQIRTAALNKLDSDGAIPPHDSSN